MLYFLLSTSVLSFHIEVVLTLSISITIPLKFVPRFPINNIPKLVQIMAWCLPGDKPLSEPMMTILLTKIWITRPQWVLTSPMSWMIPIQMFMNLPCWNMWQVLFCKWTQVNCSCCGFTFLRIYAIFLNRNIICFPEIFVWHTCSAVFVCAHVLISWC